MEPPRASFKKNHFEKKETIEPLLRGACYQVEQSIGSTVELDLNRSNTPMDPLMDTPALVGLWFSLLLLLWGVMGWDGMAREERRASTACCAPVVPGFAGGSLLSPLPPERRHPNLLTLPRGRCLGLLLGATSPCHPPTPPPRKLFFFLQPTILAYHYQLTRNNNNPVATTQNNNNNKFATWAPRSFVASYLLCNNLQNKPITLPPLVTAEPSRAPATLTKKKRVSRCRAPNPIQLVVVYSKAIALLRLSQQAT